MILRYISIYIHVAIALIPSIAIRLGSMQLAIRPLTMVGAAIREKRGDLGLGQKELAEKAGIAQSTVSALERGYRQPTAAVLNKIEKVLEIPQGTFSQYLHSREEDGADPKIVIRAETLNELIAAFAESYSSLEEVPTPVCLALAQLCLESARINTDELSLENKKMILSQMLYLAQTVSKKDI